MLQKLLKNKKFNSTIIKFYKKHKKDIIDILIFGSITKGKEKPNDIDILLLFKDKEDLDITYELKKELKIMTQNFQIISKTYNDLFDKNFKARGAYLSEAYSLINKIQISQGLSYINLMLFKYELKGFSQSKRMQFQYALYGRDKKGGITKDLELNKFAGTIFLCPMKNAEKMKEFLNNWKINFEMIPIIVPTQQIT